jgi:hypothetical protein
MASHPWQVVHGESQPWLWPMLGFDELAICASVTYFHPIEDLIVTNWLDPSMSFPNRFGLSSYNQSEYTN